MKTIKTMFRFMFLVVISASFSQCASTMKLQKEAPTTFKDVYTQNWVAGVKGGGSGVNVFIEAKSTDIVLDSVYFRGKIAKLETKPANKNLFIGRFLIDANSNEFDVTETTDEANSVEAFPFTLEDNQCVVSYQSNGKTKYFKITEIKEKPLEALPMSGPPNKN